MASLKVKQLQVSPRTAYVLHEALDGHKPENLRDARQFITVLNALGAVFNYAALTAVHKDHIKMLEDARAAHAEGTASKDQENLLRLKNDEWFAQLHAAFDSADAVSTVEFPVEATSYVVKWLEKQSFNMLGARLMVAFCDMYEDAPESISTRAKE